MGQDHAGSGVESGHRLLREGRSHRLPRRPRVLHRRLRLHDLHRQLGALLDRDLDRGAGQRPRRHRRAVGQPQLRGPHQPRRQDELPRVAATGHRLRARRVDELRLRERRARQGSRGLRRLPARHLARGQRGAEDDRRVDRHRHVHARVRRRLRRRRALADAADPEGQHLRVERRVDLRPEAPVLRRHDDRDDPGRSTSPARASSPSSATRSPPTTSARLDHQGRQPRRSLPDRARHRAQGLQQLRLAPRQPRGHDPRHVREHPPAQPAAGRRRGRLHARLHQARRPAVVHLRRQRELPGRGHAARRPGRQGVRLGLIA